MGKNNNWKKKWISISFFFEQKKKYNIKKMKKIKIELKDIVIILIFGCGNDFNISE